MNLAIEYMIRSGEIHSNVKFPISVFINNQDAAEKRVVTVSEAFNQSSLAVKQWFVTKCNAEEMVPPFEWFEISRDDLFTSEHAVVPGFSLHEYAADPFRTGRKQHADEPLASADEDEYNSKFDFLLNSKRHQSSRANWLWAVFKQAYNFDHRGHAPVQADACSQILKNEAPHLFKKWALWRKYMLDFSTGPGEVSGELMFHNDYDFLIKRENRQPNVLPAPPLKADKNCNFTGRSSLWTTHGSCYATNSSATTISGVSWNNYYIGG
jgi:hypothetical protein